MSAVFLYAKTAAAKPGSEPTSLNAALQQPAFTLFVFLPDFQSRKSCICSVLLIVQSAKLCTRISGAVLHNQKLYRQPVSQPSGLHILLCFHTVLYRLPKRFHRKP